MKKSIAIICLLFLGVIAAFGQSLSVTSPAARATWCRGQSSTITWTSRGAVGATVRIRLMQGSTAVQEITLSTPNNGSFLWPIPATTAPGSYTVRVRSLENATVDDSAAFTIANCTTPEPPPPGARVSPMTLTSPARGDILCAGRSYPIRWNRGSNTDPQVRIYLMTSTLGYVPSFNVVVPNTGTYNWTVPAEIISESHMLVIEPPVNDPLAPIRLAEGPVFQISHCYAGRPTISYTGPRHIEVCGDMATIQWRSSGDTIPSVNIDFMAQSLPFGIYRLITATPNTGSVRLRLPAPLASGIREYGNGRCVGILKISSTADHEIENPDGLDIWFTRCLPTPEEMSHDIILNPIDTLYLPASPGSDPQGGYWADFDLRKIKAALGDPSQPLSITLFLAGRKVADLGHIGGGKTPPDQVRASLEAEVYKMFFENLQDFAILLKTLEGKQVAKIKTEVIIQK